MKNLLIIVALSISSLSFGQGNLQFNQVVTYEGNLGTYTPWFKPPANKVWKIESSYIKKSTNCNSYTEVNGFAADANNGERYPIWINDQDSIRLHFTCGGSNTYSISILEFNVVP